MEISAFLAMDSLTTKQTRGTNTPSEARDNFSKYGQQYSHRYNSTLGSGGEDRLPKNKKSNKGVWGHEKYPRPQTPLLTLGMRIIHWILSNPTHLCLWCYIHLRWHFCLIKTQPALTQLKKIFLFLYFFFPVTYFNFMKRK